MLTNLSYDAAVRALDLQEQAVEQLRARTSTLLAASSLTASFLGAQSIQRVDGLEAFELLALVCLVGSVGLSVYVLLPRRGLVFGLSGPTMYEELFEFRDDDAEIHKRLIYWLDAFRQRNQLQINTLDRYHMYVAIILLLQLAFWSWALLGTIS